MCPLNDSICYLNESQNSAVDRTFQVKIHQNHHRQPLKDIRRGLHGMFDDVLNQARDDLVEAS